MHFIDRHEADAYHKMFYDRHLWQTIKFLGVGLLKCPLDLWLYQEIIFETKPSAIIECGTQQGGSTLFLAKMLDLCGRSEDVLVHSIDIDTDPNRPYHSRIHYHHGSSTDSLMVGKLRSDFDLGPAPMIILDSAHNKNHVRLEMEIYGSLVAPGGYMIVEDSNVHGHPVLPKLYGKEGGPYEAIEDFLKTHNEFEVDLRQERFGVTQNPNGYLRRKP